MEQIVRQKRLFNNGVGCMEDLMILIDTYLKNTQGEPNALGKLIRIAIIVIITRVIIAIINKFIDSALKRRKGSTLSLTNRRANTFGEILKKLVKYLLYFVAIVTILEMFNINTTSILATAGIGGIAIGFGAQSLVKDIITGFFILLEDQYVVGDFIKIGEFDGTVEELGLRVTKLRDLSGELHIIPNGMIQIVTNNTRGTMRALVKISISYEEDIDRVMKILERVCKDVKHSNKSVFDGPTILGVTDLAESGVSITIVAHAKPMDQWSVEREIRKKVKEAFDKEGIKVPYPRRLILGGKE